MAARDKHLVAKRRQNAGRAGLLPALLARQLGSARNPKLTGVGTNSICRRWAEGSPWLWPEETAGVVSAWAPGSHISVSDLVVSGKVQRHKRTKRCQSRVAVQHPCVGLHARWGRGASRAAGMEKGGRRGCAVLRGGRFFSFFDRKITLEHFWPT